MEFRQSAPDELSPPPPPPPSMWLQRSISDQPPPKPLSEMELRRSSPNQPSHGNLNEQLAPRGNQIFYEGVLLEEKEAISESKGVDMLSLEPKVREATEHKEENNIQDETASTSVKADVSWSAWRATLSQTGHVLKTVTGVLKILKPEKVDISKDQPVASDSDIQRAIEKQKIREEIIAAEMARRQELEAEVREELRIERELALRNNKGGNTFDNLHIPMEPCGKSLTQEVEGLTLEDNIAMSAGESLRIQGRTENSGMDMLPFQQTSLDSKFDETVQGKEKNIFPTKPSADVFATEKEDLVEAKESACTVFNAWGIGDLDGKKVWICFICQVSATSEADLKQHFTGNEHRHKRDALQADKSAAVTGKAVQISQIEPLMPTEPPSTGAKPLDGHGTSMLLPKNKNKAKSKEKFAFWCEMCYAGANSKHLMEAHWKGKKHLSQLKKKCPFWCDLCNVGAYREHNMEAHLRGKRHLTMLQEKADSTISELGKRHLTMLQEKADSTTSELGNSPTKIVCICKFLLKTKTGHLEGNRCYCNADK